MGSDILTGASLDWKIQSLRARPASPARRGSTAVIMSTLYQMPGFPPLCLNTQPKSIAPISPPSGIFLPELAAFPYASVSFSTIAEHEFVILRDRDLPNPWDQLFSVIDASSLRDAKDTCQYPSSEIPGNLHYGFVPFLVDAHRPPASIAGQNDLGWVLRAPGYEMAPLNESLLQIFADDSRVGALMGSGFAAGSDPDGRPVLVLATLELTGAEYPVFIHGLAWHTVNVLTSP